ncbi:MAG: hypothetical protein K2Q18_12900 [Bdellovibrionales bacterium]|nr:hypothetical protein [Bdellovibrionales bacterium]
MKNHASGNDGSPFFYAHEISKMERILSLFNGHVLDEKTKLLRKDLVSFLEEYCERKNIQLLDYIPEYSDFLKQCVD